MKCKRLILAIAVLLVPAMMLADGYTTLWKKVAGAREKDLPKTTVEWLQKIIDKASAEKAYGQLLAAELSKVQAESAISPDSLMPALMRLQSKERSVRSSDHVMAAIYESVLGRLLLQSGAEPEAFTTTSQEYYRLSMQYPDLLAQYKTTAFEPLFDRGTDSRIFGDDLLHVIGFAAGDYQALHDYYQAHGNRAAACICAYRLVSKQHQDEVKLVRKSKYLNTIDSLIHVYQDLPEAGELAIERYTFMKEAEDATVEERVRYINYAVGKWGRWPRINRLRNELKELTRPSFTLAVGNEVTIPNHRVVLNLRHVRAVGGITITVSRLTVDATTRLDPGRAKDLAALRKLVQPFRQITKTFRYVGIPDYQLSADSLVIDGLEPGVYLADATTPGSDVAEHGLLLYVTNVATMQEALPDNQIRYIAVNATTGQPLPGATLHLGYGQYTGRVGAEITLTCDDKGEAVYRYADVRPISVYATTADDRYCPDGNAWGGYHYWEAQKYENSTQLFTDRALYRPGQTVHVAVLTHQLVDGKQAHVRSGQTVVLTLRDANYKEVEKKTVTTDELGMAAADFTLPAAGLTGRFSIRSSSDGGSAFFDVEEYKRPTFEVDFPEVNYRYQAGDTLMVKATARSYAGVPVQRANVGYRVVRRTAWWWRGYGDYDGETVLEDSVMTDDNGYFTVSVPLTPEPGVTMARSHRDARYYNFVVTAAVTDRSGETREGEMTLPLSTWPTAFSATLPSKVERDSLKTLTFIYKNGAGANIASTVNYFFDNGPMKRAKTNEPVSLASLSGTLRSGRHLLTAYCDKDTLKQAFVVFSMDDTVPAEPTDCWFYVSGKEFAGDGRPVCVQVGSSAKDQYIVYTVFSGEKMLEQGVIRQSNAVNTRRFTYKPEYGDGILLTYAWMKDGVGYTRSAAIRRALPDKKLNISWKTFRDRLTPGQKEEWTLTVAQPDGKPAKAGLLAVLYDKSLDQITGHSWTFSLNRRLYLPSTGWQVPVSLSNPRPMSVVCESPLRLFPLHSLSFSDFRKEYFYDYLSVYSALFGSARGLRVRGVGTARPEALMKESAVMAYDVVGDADTMTGNTVMSGAESTDEKKEYSGGKEVGRHPQLRQNLNETAFFYPNLLADGQGHVSIKFTLPESVTTWRFMGLAHDHDMNYGSIEAEAVAKKTVMVQPYLPRFLREGDCALIRGNVSNTSERAVKATARLELLDAVTGRTLYTKEQAVSLAAGRTESVAFRVDLAAIGVQPSVLVCRMTADGRGFSDGEQHYLPVLSTREVVTTTFPFTQHGPGVKTVDLDSLAGSNASGRSLTIEYTNNPSWLMIQALPTVCNPWEDNAVSLVTGYYANSISRYLLKQVPAIRQVMTQWQKEPDGGSLKSSLQRNEELKTLVLNDTPWLLEAEGEAEQKQLLVDYFDEAKTAARIDGQLDKLRRLQNTDGSWSWWPGMRGSMYITVAVSEALARLNKMIGTQEETAGMLARALRFMEKEVADEVVELKKKAKNGERHLLPSEMALHYLYLRALDGRAFSVSAEADKDYLLKMLAVCPAALTIYGKANSAVILALNGYKRQAADYLQSMEEYSVYKEEMGRYYDTRKAGYSWFDYKIPTEVAAIEALRLLKPEAKQTIKEMQRWLLQCKRTQAWDTPVNTVNAVYAFGVDKAIARSGGAPAVMKLDGKRIALPEGSAGLGYVKMRVEDDHAKTFTVEKTTEGTSWGALYVQQFMAMMEGVGGKQESAAGLAVKREIVGGSRVGDRVKVRITITADRDYDFVQVVDKRAACLEPVEQLSGYRMGCYVTPRDNATNYYFDRLPKGKRVIETEYFIDRAGEYTGGSVTVQCAYAPEFNGRCAGRKLTVAEK